MNNQNLWLEENKEKYHQFLYEIINFHNPKIAIGGVLMSPGWSSLIRVIAVEKKYRAYSYSCNEDFGKIPSMT